MNINNLLPIGTIVKLNAESEVKYMVVGYFPQNAKGDRKDYVLVRYPIGAINSKVFFFVNQEQIKDVVFEGYKDKDFSAMAVLMDNAQRQEKGQE